MPDNNNHLDVPENIFALDPNDIPRVAARKQVFTTGQLETYSTNDINGEPATGYFKADAVRLTRLTVRMQEVRDSRTDRMKPAIVVNFSLVADGDDIGIVNPDGSLTPHPLYTENRYAMWQKMSAPEAGSAARPHRIDGQQFVQMENAELLVDLLNFLDEDHVPMQVIKNPAKPDHRKIPDKFVVSPVNTSGDVRTLGVEIDWFEISTNEDRDRTRNFGRGFKNFYAGLEDQRLRIERALKQGEKDQRLMLQSFHAMRRNINYLNGVFNQREVDERRGASTTGSVQDWPRKADMGAFGILGRSFNLYRPGSVDISLDDFDVSEYVSSEPELSVEGMSSPDVFTNRNDDGSNSPF